MMMSLRSNWAHCSRSNVVIVADSTIQKCPSKFHDMLALSVISAGARGDYIDSNVAERNLNSG